MCHNVARGRRRPRARPPPPRGVRPAVRAAARTRCSSARASVSIVSDGRDDTPTRLLRDADVAVFAAKELGRGPGRAVRRADARPGRAPARDRELACARALVRGEFRVHYQPVVAFARSEMIGIEALVRWEHPELGLLEPADFLEIAEETGLIVPIGAWVLHEACSQTARWSRGAAARVAAVDRGQPLRPPAHRPRARLDRRVGARGDAPRSRAADARDQRDRARREPRGRGRRAAAARGARRAHRHRRLRYRAIVARAPERAARAHAEDRPVADRGSRAGARSRGHRRPRSSASVTRSTSR